MKRVFIGMVVIVASELGMLLRLEPFWSWHTPIAWTGYIVLVDGIVYRRRGNSWLSNSLPEFVFLAAVSFPLWLVFEFFNLFIRNWHYVNLPESRFWRDVGYAWAFATIWPAIFETAELVASLRTRRIAAKTSNPAQVGSHVRMDAGKPGPGPAQFDEPRNSASAVPGDPGGVKMPLSKWGMASVVLGAAMLLWPLVWPSRYLAAPVWLGFIFLLDPLNARAGGESLTADYRFSRELHPVPSSGAGRSAGDRTGPFDRAINLMVGGLACGFVWELWNYWARTKWIYTVPILPNLKLFEMPLPGYLGFPAFALECFTMYVCFRVLAGRRRGRPIAL